MKMRERLFSVTVLWDLRWLDIHLQGLFPLSGGVETTKVKGRLGKIPK